MHPIVDKFFGTTGFAVGFNNGSGVVYGHIIRQIGTTRYVVTDGTVTKTVNLAQDAATAAAPTGNVGVMTARLADGTAVYVAKLTRNHAFVVGGNPIRWNGPSPAITVDAMGTANAILLEDGSELVLEDGSPLLLES